MAIFTSLNDDGSSSFLLIGSVGRSSRKPGSEMWTLLSRICRYSANQAMINLLFLISTPSVLWMLSECCQAGMLSKPAVLLSLRQKWPFSLRQMMMGHQVLR